MKSLFLFMILISSAAAATQRFRCSAQLWAKCSSVMIAKTDFSVSQTFTEIQNDAEMEIEPGAHYYIIGIDGSGFQPDPEQWETTFGNPPGGLMIRWDERLNRVDITAALAYSPSTVPLTVAMFGYDVATPAWAQTDEAKAFFLGVAAAFLVGLVHVGLRWFRRVGDDTGGGGAE